MARWGNHSNMGASKYAWTTICEGRDSVETKVNGRTCRIADLGGGKAEVAVDYKVINGKIKWNDVFAWVDANWDPYSETDPERLRKQEELRAAGDEILKELGRQISRIARQLDQEQKLKAKERAELEEIAELAMAEERRATLVGAGSW